MMMNVDSFEHLFTGLIIQHNSKSEVVIERGQYLSSITRFSYLYVDRSILWIGGVSTDHHSCFSELEYR